jgi:hypothetical protein
MKSFLFLTELFLAVHDGALAGVVMTHGAGAAVGHSTSPATASHRKRKKPPRWLRQPQQQETVSFEFRECKGKPIQIQIS